MDRRRSRLADEAPEGKPQLDRLQALVSGREREMLLVKDSEGLLVELAQENTWGNVTAAAQMSDRLKGRGAQYALPERDPGRRG